MNELVAIFNNCIKSKSSLKECVEFAFHDEEIEEALASFGEVSK